MKHASTAFPAKGPSLRVGEGCRGLFVKIPKSQKLSQKYFIQILFNKWKRTFFTSPVLSSWAIAPAENIRFFPWSNVQVTCLCFALLKLRWWDATERSDKYLWYSSMYTKNMKTVLTLTASACRHKTPWDWSGQECTSWSPWINC